MKRSLRTFLELFLVPGMAAVLPWAWCFRLFQRVARSGRLYPEVAWMLQGARDIGMVDDEQKWRSALRLTRIFSFADLYLSMCRSDRWLRRYVDVSGSWPEGAFMAVTYHWGAGLWALRHLRASGKRTAFLSIRFDRAMFQHSRLRYWYALLRTRETARAGGGAPTIFTGGSSARIAAAYQQNVCVAALLDVPPKPEQASVPILLFGRPAHLRRGLARVAIDGTIPVVTFAMNLDRQTGRLKLRIEGPLPAQTEAELMQHMTASFCRALERDPAAWHGWGEVQLYLRQQAAA
jgi:hypothetical protein